MSFRSATLDNGLTIIAEVQPEAYSQGLGYFVCTGARDETDSLSGVSHFLEHMAFKGTATRSAEDVNRDFDEIGGNPNAYTSDEHTVYHAAVLPEYQDRCVELLSDLLRPELRTTDFDLEKNVILEEIQMYDDQPPFGADDKCKAAWFGEHPLARSVLGTLDSVGALTAMQMREYHAQRYAPGNITMVAAGRVDFDALVKQVDRCCGRWAASDAARWTGQPRSRTGFHCFNKPSASQEYVVQYAESPPVTDDAIFAASLLTVILGDDSGSRMFWELLDPGLADSAGMYLGNYVDAGVYVTYLSGPPELAAENLQKIHAMFRQVEAEGITEAELNQARNKLNSHLVLAGERPMRRLFSVGSNWLQRGEYRTIHDDLATIAALTTDDIKKVLKDYPLTRARTVCIGPLDKVEEPK